MPVVTVDILLCKNNRYLLGLRKNKPAKNQYFTPGGRLFKNESLAFASRRIAKDELNIEISQDDLIFVGIYQHLFEDSIYYGINSHCLNLAYKIEITGNLKPQSSQHSQLKWFKSKEVTESKKVHQYTKTLIKLVELKEYPTI